MIACLDRVYDYNLMAIWINTLIILGGNTLRNFGYKGNFF